MEGELYVYVFGFSLVFVNLGLNIFNMVANKQVKEHIKYNNLGLSTQSGFMNWKNIDIDKYQEEKLKKFVKITKLLNIQPKIKI